MNRKKITVPAQKGFLPVLAEYFHKQPFCVLNSNQWPENFHIMIAAGAMDELKVGGNAFETLKNYHEREKDWLFGYFGYDLKNQVEALKSENEDKLDFPDIWFFRPRFLIIYKEDKLELHYHENKENEAEAKSLLQALKENIITPFCKNISQVKEIKLKIRKEEYLHKVKSIQDHIQRGDIYEMNFCQEFYSEDILIEPFEVYNRLNEISPMPFSCYLHHHGKYLICASPERYLQKKGNKIISQPIKGTMKRGASAKEDLILKKSLHENPKEQIENVMIVDLVRNDLSQTAHRGSVKVEELFAIRSFPQVHQMVSTVSAELKQGKHFTDVIRTTFPMGSMTGAPKVRAMEIIETYETTKRGLFSGAAGYITPQGDFDLNVVIRSILFNSRNRYLSFMTGSAITAKSDPEKEYEECLVKAKAIFTALGF